MSVSIELRSFSEVAALSSWQAFVDEYIEETANSVIPNPGPQMQRYKALEEAGVLRCIAVLDGDTLAGLSVLVVTASQHYPHPVIGVDSLYLRKPWRKGRTGIDLLGAMRATAKREGAPGFVIMAPPGSVLEKLCERWGYVNTHKAYWCPA